MASCLPLQERGSVPICTGPIPTGLIPSEDFSEGTMARKRKSPADDSHVEHISRPPDGEGGRPQKNAALFVIDAELVEAAERTEAFLGTAVATVSSASALAGRGLAALSSGAARALLSHAGADGEEVPPSEPVWRARIRSAERSTGEALESFAAVVTPAERTAEDQPLLVRSIRRHPAVSLGIAAGAGLLIGLLVRRTF